MTDAQPEGLNGFAPFGIGLTAMELRLYDTMTKEKRPFAPLDPDKVRVYACGPTVYDFIHIGNGRMAVVFDVLFRLLRQVYGDGKVVYARNVTDVDDKINARAAREYPALALNDAIRNVTRKTEAQFHEDVDALGCLRPTVEPRATEHIAEMRALIDRLIANGNAYVEQDHVLFAVDTMQEYGRLSRRSLDEMVAGARIDVAPYKRGEMDFVLWKPSKADEPSWPSPGSIKVEGRPGWHIECSAMAWKHLGEVFDIHGGGIDLVFPHHENEIAQTCCAFHSQRMAQVWMHNGFLQVEGDKMSKSLGNFVTVRELLTTDTFGGRKWPGDVLRLALLRTHYRSPMDWTLASLEESEKVLENWIELLKAHRTSFGRPMAHNAVVEAVADDLNTSQAIAELHRLAGAVRSGGAAAAQELHTSLEFLGVISEASFSSRKTQELSEAAARLIDERKAARARKDFKESDRLRDELAAIGVLVKDGKDANGNPVTTWEIAR
jgi:cysteinyl-tRNA synthetase